MLARRGEMSGALSSFWLRDPGDCVGSDLFRDVTNPMPVFCYDFKARGVARGGFWGVTPPN